MHAKGKPIDPEIELDALAAGTPGFTGADLANLVNEAALLAARRGQKTIGQEELEEGIMRVIAGPEKKTRLFSEHERKITAYHEMGHALVGHYLEQDDEVHKISIISRGQALGYTISLPREDRYLTTRSALMDQLAMTLGGRAAEELVFNEVTTGAANDLEKVTSTAKQMVMRYGMSEKLGPRVLGRNHDMPFLGPRDGRGARLLRGDRARDRRRDPPRDRGGARAGAQGARGAHGRAAPAVGDPHRARDDRQGPVQRLLAGETEEEVFAEEVPESSEPAKPKTERRTRVPKPKPFPLPGRPCSRRRPKAPRAERRQVRRRSPAPCRLACEESRKTEPTAEHAPGKARHCAEQGIAVATNSCSQCTAWTPIEERFPRPSVMGVVNVTPDTFSDGGVNFDTDDAVAAALRMVEEGAAIVDVGGESTRPGSDGVSLDEELRRVEPVLEALQGRVPVSIDTTKAEVARRALALGVELVNDVSALRSDPELAEESHPPVPTFASCTCRESRGRCRTNRPTRTWPERLRPSSTSGSRFAVGAGVPEERICLDPGFGFGKSVGQNFELLGRLGEIVALGRPVLVGLSRKSSLGRILGDPEATTGPLSASLAAAVGAYERGATIFRAHDVREHVEALTVAATVG